jgi:hypothetical protein
MQDMGSKGRAAHGKLTPDQVLEIRRLYAQGNTSCYKLGVLFGVDHTSIWAIISRKSWVNI